MLAVEEAKKGKTIVESMSTTSRTCSSAIGNTCTLNIAQAFK
jgi:hypothetical protein